MTEPGATEPVGPGHTPAGHLFGTDADRPGRGPRKLVVLTHGYYPRIGGIERQRSQVTPRLVASGLDVTVVTRSARHATRTELREGVKILRILSIGGKAPGSATVRRLIWKVAKPFDVVSYTVGALVAVVRRRPDVIHTHEFISTARVGLLAGRILRCPVIVTSHRSGPLGDVGRQAGSARGERLLARIVGQAALAIAVSDEIDGELAAAGIPAERRLVVHNGVDTERFCPADEDEKVSLRTALDLPADRPTVIFIGRLMPEKRVALLLRVWPDILQTVPDAELVIVGTGDDEAALRTGAPSSVTFVGAVADTSPYLRAADVFVLPSAAEGLSNAVLEAQACGLATVISDVGAARDVVTDTKNGLIIGVDNAEALHKALITVLTQTDYRQYLGGNARENAVTRFSIDSTVSAFVAAYKQVYRTATA